MSTIACPYRVIQENGYWWIVDISKSRDERPDYFVAEWICQEQDAQLWAARLNVAYLQGKEAAAMEVVGVPV